MNENREKEDAEAKANRVAKHHQTATVLRSSPEYRWLFIELALANSGECDWQDSNRLEQFISEPIWAALWDSGGYSLQSQARLYVDQPKFHCTALRDFFVTRLISALSKGVKEYEEKPTKILTYFLAAACVGTLSIFSGLLATALALILVFSFAQIIYLRSRWKRLWTIVSSSERVTALGGFDEMDIIKHLEILQKRGVGVPSVLFALLRIPRRNVEYSISKVYNLIHADKKKALNEQWEAFLNEMVNYEEV